MKNCRQKIILAIETSCDETSISILKGMDILVMETNTQIDKHKVYGGVIPEVAARLHLEVIDQLVKKALQKAKLKITSIEYIAVTKEPGLINALHVGLIFAKTLTQLLKIPLLGINHLEGHIYSPFIDKEDKLKFPMICAIFSGGHTDLIYVEKLFKYKLIGSTKDDTIGESYDKVARMANLEYPGGPKIEEYNKIKTNLVLTRPKVDGLNFSFSGLKSQVKKNLLKNQKEEVLKAFHDCAISYLIDNIIKASNLYKTKNIAVTGGVSASPKLREDIKKTKLNCFFPEPKYCVDNAGMIGYTAYLRIKDNNYKILDLREDSHPKNSLY